MSEIKDNRLWLKRKYLIVLRKKMKLSQKTIGGLTGYKRQDWNKYECGQNHWSTDRMVVIFDEISEALGISAAVLIEAEMSYRKELAELRKAIQLEDERAGGENPM